MTPEISAVICTHNRASYLAKALGSLDQQTLPKSRYEILVVDNCSSDTTRELVLERAKTMENLRYLYEPVLGLSTARNHGLSEARGAYIAFLDDDAIADPDWLEWAVRVHTESTGDLGFLGGKVRPIWESERPDWLSDDLLPFLTMTDLGEVPIDVEGASGLVGANMTFRSQVLRESGGFPIALGRKGNSLLSNEELQLKKELQQRGLRSVYHPRVAVSHHAIASRLTKPWFRRRLYWQGRSDAIWWRIDTRPSGSEIMVELVRKSVLIAKLGMYWLRQLTATSNRNLAFSQGCQVLLNYGYLVELIRSYDRK